MTTPTENRFKWEQPPPPPGTARSTANGSPAISGTARGLPRLGWRWRNVAVLLVTLALLATTTAVAGAQRPSSGSDGSTAGDAGPQTCAELGLPVVEPISVSWEASWEPARNPNYLWAYGDVDDLWDDSLNEYWYHWYGAVPGPDPHVEYRFEPGTTIEAVQFHTN